MRSNEEAEIFQERAVRWAVGILLIAVATGFVAMVFGRNSVLVPSAIVAVGAWTALQVN